MPRAEVRKKYTSYGSFGKRSFPLGVDACVVSILAPALNASKSYSSWKNHKTAVSHVDKAQRRFGVKLAIPFTENMVYAYVAYLRERGLQVETIRQYMAAIRVEHLAQGHFPEALKPDLLERICEGMKKLQGQEKKKKERGPITLDRLLKLRDFLRGHYSAKSNRAAMWAAAAFMFWGSLRPGEALAEGQERYNPASTLQMRDVRLKTVKVDGVELECLVVKLKCPKEARGDETEVEMMPNGSRSCPVKAWKHFLKTRTHKLRPSEPVFQWADGRLIVASDVQSVLEECFQDELGPREFLSCHSFRSGIATELARSGADDETIMRQGRWKSSAFLCYVKLGRKERWQKQLAIAKRIAEQN